MQVAGDVRALRRLKLGDLTEPFDPDAGDDFVDEEIDIASLDLPSRHIEAAIGLAVTPDSVRAIWQIHQADWTDDLTTIAAARVAALEKGISR